MFHKYPYTDFHELNLDGLIAEWKKFLNEYQSVNKRVDDMEQAIEDFREYINNYFDNLDVQEEINNKLDEMEADGSLETILSHYVYNTHNPDLVQVLNVAMNTHVYDVPSDPQPAFLQGYTCYNGVSYLAFMDHTSTGTDAIIRSYSNSTGQLLNEARISNAHHANSLTVHEGHLLLCTNEYHIISINPSTLAFEISYTVTKNIKSISSYNGILYCTDSNYDCYQMTLPPDESYTLKCNFQASNPEYSFIQSNCVYGDYIYCISSNPKVIAAVNINTGAIRNIINIDDYYYMYPTGEIEDLQIVSGDEVYLACCTYGTYDQYRTGRVFNFSLNQNDARSQRYAGGDYNPIATLYVDNNTNGNPDGTATNPFPTLSQAFQAISSEIARSYQTDYIYMLKDCDEIVYQRNNSFRLNGNGYKIKRALITNCRALFNNVAFDGVFTGSFHTLYAVDSFISLYACTFAKYAGSEYLAQLTRCVGTIQNITVHADDIAADGFYAYMCNFRTNDASALQIAFDRESATSIDYGAVTSFKLPHYIQSYRSLGIRYSRGYDRLYTECAIPAPNSQLNTKLTFDATTGLVNVVNINVYRDGSNNITLTVSGNNITSSLSKVALDDPGTINNVILLTY